MITDIVWKFIKSWEGGDTITNDKDDTGGLTRWGISKNNNIDVDVANLTEDMAKQIYYERYWVKSYCHYLPEFMQLVVMNCAVNCGVRTAKKLLQKVVGVHDDGVIGKVSRDAIMYYRGTPMLFTTWFLTYHALYYFNIVDRRRSQYKWLKGWMRRTFSAAWQTAVNYGKT